MKPWPGTFTHWQRPHGAPLRLLLDDIVIADGTAPEAAAPGSVVVSGGDLFEVATGGGILSLLKVQPAGKRVMAIDEFLRGYPIPVGAILIR